MFDEFLVIEMTFIVQCIFVMYVLKVPSTPPKRQNCGEG